MEYAIDAEIRSPHVQAQLRSYSWPRMDETVLTFKDYQIGRTLPHGGELRARLEGSEKPWRFGELSLIASDIPLVFQPPKGEGRIFVCAYARDYFEEMTGLSGCWKEYELMHHLDLKSASVRMLMQRMQRELQEPGFASQAYIESAGNLVLIEVARYLNALRGRPTPALTKYRGLTPWQMRRIQERMAAIGEMGPPSIADLADLCGLSQDYMMRGFKVSTGKTVHKYVEEERLNFAQQLLAESSLSLKQIAHRLGFSSQAYFSAGFRRLMDMTPSEFRTSARIR